MSKRANNVSQWLLSLSVHNSFRSGPTGKFRPGWTNPVIILNQRVASTDLLDRWKITLFKGELNRSSIMGPIYRNGIKTTTKIQQVFTQFLVLFVIGPSNLHLSHIISKARQAEVSNKSQAKGFLLFICKEGTNTAAPLEIRFEAKTRTTNKNQCTFSTFWGQLASSVWTCT